MNTPTTTSQKAPRRWFLGMATLIVFIALDIVFWIEIMITPITLFLAVIAAIALVFALWYDVVRTREERKEGRHSRGILVGRLSVILGLVTLGTYWIQDFLPSPASGSVINLFTPAIFAVASLILGFFVLIRYRNNYGVLALILSVPFIILYALLLWLLIMWSGSPSSGMFLFF